MQNITWLKQYRWLLGGLALACLALIIIAIIWGIQEHQYQLALTQYHAALSSNTQSTGNTDQGQHTSSSPNPFLHPPVDTAGPGAWGVAGWIFRLLAITIPMLIGFLLYWRESHWQRQQQQQTHKAHLAHATNRLAEAITVNQELPSGVFDAYSKLRELDS
jgi:hypothetical protein